MPEIRSIILLVFVLPLAWSLAVDNSLEGDPEINCGPTAITVNFNTRNPFEGNIFVKGLFSDSECSVSRSSDSGQRVAGITLGFGACNVRRTRSLSPRGVFVGATVVISFHPQFITMQDRAFSVQCFYMEADKTVSQDIEVSMLTTGFFTQNVPMPICTYQILDGPNADPIRYAFVGQTVFHKWTCETQTTDIFCMRVHSCYVDDGAGDKVDLLDQDGCAQDRYLLNNLNYIGDLMAGQQTMVFKYADRAKLFFQCQITLTVKEPDSECPKPACAEPQRGRRSIMRRDSPPVTAGTLDVYAEFDSLDIDDKMLHGNYPKLLSTRARKSQAEVAVCLSRVAFGITTTILIVLLTASVSSSVLLYLRR